MVNCTCGALIIYYGEGAPDISGCSRGMKCPDLRWSGARHIRPGWDEWAMSLAHAVATRGDCRRAQVGAVILGTDHRVVGTGYNGHPAGVPGCLSGACPRGAVPPSQLPSGSPYNAGVGRCDAVHAESNALLHSDRRDVRGGTLYVTLEPCHGCRVLMAGAGLARWVWPNGEVWV